MKELLINEATSAELAVFLKNPSHALLLAGPEGSGRLALAKSLANELLGASKVANDANFRLVEPDEKGLISIDEIRKLKDFTKLKSSAKRLIIIAGADRMSLGAQNSFLKLLEEPPENTFIILTALAGKLRPTIISRVQQVRVRPVSLAVAKDYFDASSEKIELAFQVSGGRVGLASQLLASDGESIELALADARTILTSDHYGRLCQVDALAKDKTRALAALAMLGQMASTALTKASDNANLKRWQKVLAASYQAESALASSANGKLVLTNLMLQL